MNVPSGLQCAAKNAAENGCFDALIVRQLRADGPGRGVELAIVLAALFVSSIVSTLCFNKGKSKHDRCGISSNGVLCYQVLGLICPSVSLAEAHIVSDPQVSRQA